MTGWIAADGRAVWPVDHYGEETARVQRWLGRDVLTYHRRPDLAQHRRRPPVLLVAAGKPPTAVRTG